ncbi:MAG: hypothetical protein K2Q15_15710 [Burkholderiales bacterium]|nr:hypothetical protein [Burkholderiales bacterium]
MLVAITARDSGDVVSKSLLRVHKNDSNFSIIDISDLTASAKININHSGCSQLTFGNLIQLPPQASACINRAMINSDILALSKEKPHILQTELECLLQTYINNFAKSTAKAGLYSLCGDYLPLYMQWQKVQKELPICIVPKYQYVFGSLAPDVHDFQFPIYKSTFDLRTWKPNSEPASFWHTFVVDRPKGKPVVVANIGESIFFSEEQNDSLKIQLQKFSLIICKIFSSEIGETLFFIDNDSICFAAFSHLIKLNIPDEAIDEAVITLIKKYQN